MRSRRANQGASLQGLAAIVVAVAVGCGGAVEPPSAPPKPAASAPKSDFDPCAGEAPPEKVYAGVLREARCEQEVFLTMAHTAESLGVPCKHCHVPKAGGGPNDFDYPPMTQNKEIANWMKHQLVDRLRHKDGSPVTCKSCHVGRDGKPAAKFLGEPRDPKYAMEWMSLVMVNEFTREDGGKLRCKDCHGSAPGLPAFQKKVILEGELEALPLRSDLAPLRTPPVIEPPAHAGDETQPNDGPPDSPAPVH